MLRIRSRGLSGPCGLYLAEGFRFFSALPSLLEARPGSRLPVWLPHPGMKLGGLWWERFLIKNQGARPKFGDFFRHQEFAPNFIPKLAPLCLRPSLSPLRFWISQSLPFGTALPSWALKFSSKLTSSRTNDGVNARPVLLRASVLRSRPHDSG